MDNNEYLGDGVYAEYEYPSILLRVGDHRNSVAVTLEPTVLKALLEFYERKFKEKELEQNMPKKIDYHRLVEEQKQWIAHHGSDLAGYILRYGDPGVVTENGTPMVGEGGTAIYNADIANLQRLEKLAGHPHYNVARK
jgi:hypothetical protein